MGSNSADDLDKSLKRKNNKYKKREVLRRLYPAMKNTKDGEVYGYINEKGNFEIEPIYQIAYDFNPKGLAIVTNGDYDGVIDLCGEFIIPSIYNTISQFNEGRAIFTKDNKMGIIDDEGKIISKKYYDYIGTFNDGIAVIGESDSNSYKYGYINLDGEEIIPPRYELANDFKDNVALVRLKEKEYALINKAGLIINKYNYESVSQYGDGLLVFSETISSPFGYINKNGDIVIKNIFSTALGFEEGVAVVATGENFNGPYGLINMNGEYIFTPTFSEIKYLGEGRVALGMPVGKTLEQDVFASPSIFAIGDIRGNILTTFKYLNVGDYKNGNAYASDNTSTFFIDRKGKIVNNLPKVKGSGQLEMKDKIIYANIDYSPYYITRSGKIIYKPNETIDLNNKYSLIKERYKPNYSFLIYIPQIKGVQSKRVEKKINVKLKTLSYFKPFVNEQINHTINEHDILDYSYYGTFEIQFFAKDLLVLNLSGYYYPLGAAHGLPSKITPCINLVTGEFYELKDLFKSNSNWNEELDTIIKDKIKNDPQYEYVYEDGFYGIKDGQRFYIDNNNLYIYFQPYDIGPYAAGFITFEIPISNLDTIINKDGDFYKSLSQSL